MVAPAFIRTYSKGSNATDQTGFKLEATILPQITFSAGVQTSDLSIPGSSRRILVPVSGTTEDYEVTIELVDDGTNKAFVIDSIGNETPANIITTAEQVSFLIDTIISENIGADYDVYIEWLGKTVNGILTLRGNITADAFYSVIRVSATLKVGANPYAAFLGD